MSRDWTTDNRFELLENGEEFYPRVFASIAAAKEQVYVETFILQDDKVGRQLRAALIEAARSGAEVHVLVDGWGSPDLRRDFLAPLNDSGVKLRVFDPARRWFGMRVNPIRRMHRKLVAIDGRLAYVGGINYSIDHLAEFGPMAKQDYAVEIEGPLVGQVQAFCNASLDTPEPRRTSWLRRWRQRRQRTKAPAAQADSGVAALVTRDNAHHRSDIERQYRLALRQAKRRVIIANAYFFPGYRFLKELRRAARRGVEVHLILQGQPDMPIVRTAAVALHGSLIRAGVKVHEYCERPLHGKVATIDDEWVTIGSSNLDPLSLGLNLEANVVARDRQLARTLRERLERLIDDHCRVAQLAPQTGFSSFLALLRGFLVYHLVRRFPQWLPRLPKTEQQVSALSAADTGSSS